MINLYLSDCVASKRKLKMEMSKNMIELVPEKDIDTLYRAIVKFMPEVIPEPDELEVIRLYG